jgi:Mn2+/Fe2+ NRAMP family transporter
VARIARPKIACFAIDQPLTGKGDGNMKNTGTKRIRTLFYILSIVGPGIITVNAGNDAGGIYTAMIALGVLLILIPGIPLVQLTLVTQQIAGFLSPIILVFMIILVNDKRIMGSHVNGKVQNIISGATVAFIASLSMILLIFPLLG